MLSRGGGVPSATDADSLLLRVLLHRLQLLLLLLLVLAQLLLVLRERLLVLVLRKRLLGGFGLLVAGRHG